MNKRQVKTEERRDAILQAALACFTENGMDKTTIKMICERSGASVGSVYHHFGNKKKIATTLFILGLKNYSDRLIVELEQVKDAHSGIQVMVVSYIEWIMENPDWARFIFSARSQVIRGAAEEELKSANRRQFITLKQWMLPYIKQGILRDYPLEIYHALVNGPTQDYVRSWLSGRLKQPPDVFKDVLAEAAWRALSEPSSLLSEKPDQGNE